MNMLSRWFRRLLMRPSRIDGAALATRLGRDARLLVIDVRAPDEFTGPLEGEEFAAGGIAGHLPELVRDDRPVIVACKTDRRSSMAAHQLHEAGLSDVSVLRGGMEQWRLRGLPVSLARRQFPSPNYLSRKPNL